MNVRPAAASDAAALVELAEAVGSEPEGWLITDGEWRSVGDERRYLRAIEKLLAVGQDAAARQLVLELGKEALTENATWVLIHRERPLPAPGL